MIPKVSIIIPAYNAEKYISRAIASALKQTWKSCEVIVVNDGSTDNTLEIASTYNKVSIINKPNGRTASALNAGIRAATGNWIHWLSADDELYPQAVEKMLDIISRKYTDYFANRTIFYSHYDVIDDNGKFLRAFVEDNVNDMPREKQIERLLQFFFGNGSTSMIHRDVFKRVGYFDETLPYFEDYDFWLRCLILHGMKMQLVPEVTLKYREHSGQLSKAVDLSWNQKIKDKILAQVCSP